MFGPRRVRDAVYATFASEGRAPSLAEPARSTRSTMAEVEKDLHDLAAAHQLVLTRDGDAVRMAHPFSAAPMAFVVTPREGHDDRRWWGGCAWDSFGISAALDLDVRIDTTCPHCGAHLGYHAGPRTPPPPTLAVRFSLPAEQWWDDVIGSCTMIRTFCDRGHAEAWTRDHDSSGGCLVDATTVWRLAEPWYGDRLHPGFQPHGREHHQGLLADHGLTGPFWRLP